MHKYTHDSVVPFKDSKLSKKEQVADMFDRIALRYDFLNRLLSGGIDVRWRKKAIKELAEINPQIILDVATGTADVAVMMTKYLKPQKVIGIDISEGMLELGKEKIKELHLNRLVELYTGDGEAIDFPDAAFDAITVAFGVRNFASLEKGLTEMLRVLKPGGKLVVLEFSKPRQGVFKKMYALYMKAAAAGIGKWVAKSREAYEYLNASVNAFPEGSDFLEILSKAGYEAPYMKTLTFGICSIYGATKK